MDIFRGFRAFNREVSGWVFWPIVFGMIVLLAALAVSMR
jgi:hypothetical protein